MSENAVPAHGDFSCARRQLLLAGAGVSGVALLAACGSSSSSSAAPPASSTPAASSAPGTTAPATGGASSAPAVKGIVALADVPSDSSVSVKDSTGRTLLITQSGGTLTALDATCTHMACTVAPDPGKGILLCPCHGSEYKLTGQVIQGPAPAALHNVAVKVSSGQVVLA